MTLYLDELLQETLNKHRKAHEENNSDHLYEWFEAKDINGDSLKKVMNELSEEAAHEITEKLMGGVLDMDYVAHLFFTVIGISFELGYTAAEKQMDSKFDL